MCLYTKSSIPAHSYVPAESMISYGIIVKTYNYLSSKKRSFFTSNILKSFKRYERYLTITRDRLITSHYFSFHEISKDWLFRYFDQKSNTTYYLTSYFFCYLNINVIQIYIKNGSKRNEGVCFGVRYMGV